MPEAGAPRAEECLSDDEVLAFALGRLDGKRLEPLHAHLDQCPTCQRLLSEAAHALGTAATAPHFETDSGDWNTMFQPGTLVGNRYLIRNFLARGGMGEVYEAFDRELSERVALKTVTSTACDNPRAVRRLKAEVQLSRRVGHPNVCRIYDLGSHALSGAFAQIHFLTMQFVEGETLGQRIRLAGAIPIPETCKLARALLLGLEAAHEAGILHRDFKSDNVMLRADADGESTPVILDFGLARALDHDSRHGGSTSNPVVGTFGYIAPEQLEGKTLTPASDLYAFGVVWFEMLTGELPFAMGSSPVACALERVRRPAPAPSSINPEVPAALDAIVLRCLQRAPGERFQSAREVLVALDTLKDPPERSRFPKKRLLQLTLAASLCGLVGYWVISRHSSDLVAQTSAATPARERPQESPPRPHTEPTSLAQAPAANTLVPEAVHAAPETAHLQQKPRAAVTRHAAPQPPPVLAPSAPATTDSQAAPAAPVPSSRKPDWVNPFPANGRSEILLGVARPPN
ncbi:MAG TPA: protein kinase [Polyangiaceae bacterium]|nr:protein kinase [Polyangiaceae bacterium]